LKAIQRSIITPMDHPDMMNRTITTTFARIPICFHSEIGSQPTELSCKSQAAKRWKLQSATAARFTTMSCFSSSELFRTRFELFSASDSTIQRFRAPCCQRLLPTSGSQHDQNRLMQKTNDARKPKGGIA